MMNFIRFSKILPPNSLRIKINLKGREFFVRAIGTKVTTRKSFIQLKKKSQAILFLTMVELLRRFIFCNLTALPRKNLKTLNAISLSSYCLMQTLMDFPLCLLVDITLKTEKVFGSKTLI